MIKYSFTSDTKTLRKLGFSYEGRYYTNSFIDIVKKDKSIRIHELQAKNHTPFIKFILSNLSKPKSFWAKDIIYTSPDLTLSDMPIYAMSSFGNIYIVEDFADKQAISKKERNEAMLLSPELATQISKTFFTQNEFIKEPIYFTSEVVNSIISISEYISN